MAKAFLKTKKDAPAAPSSDKPAPSKTEYKGYESFRLQKKIAPGGALPNAFRLFGQAMLLLKNNAKLFLGMAAVYAALYVVLVQGVTALGGLSESKALLEQNLTGNFAGVQASLALFSQLLGSSGGATSTANSYQLLVTLVASLALIWTLRQVYAGQQVRVRDGYYRGMYPLIPFLLVLLVVALQLIPMAIGASLFTTAVNNGIAATPAEVALWAIGFFILAVISLYLITSSLFALYIVSLPDMAPLQALRSARELVRGRRWQVLRKILFLPLVLLVLSMVVLLPLIMFATALAGWVFFAVLALWLVVAHSYMYRLYRALL